MTDSSFVVCALDLGRVQRFVTEMADHVEYLNVENHLVQYGTLLVVNPNKLSLFLSTSSPFSHSPCSISSLLFIDPTHSTRSPAIDDNLPRSRLEQLLIPFIPLLRLLPTSLPRRSNPILPILSLPTRSLLLLIRVG